MTVFYALDFFSLKKNDTFKRNGRIHVENRMQTSQKTVKRNIYGLPNA